MALITDADRFVESETQKRKLSRGTICAEQAAAVSTGKYIGCFVRLAGEKKKRKNKQNKKKSFSSNQ